MSATTTTTKYGTCETPQYLDTLTCPCGNNTDGDGFTPSTLTAEEVTPDKDGPWDGRHVACVDCGRVFDHDAHNETTGLVPVVAGPQHYTPLPGN